MSQEHSYGFKLYFWNLFLPISLVTFYFIGKIYFDNGLGRFHSTNSLKWESLCRMTFILTFVTACTILELLLVERYGIGSPQVLQIYFLLSFGILCLILNYAIPCTLITLVCLQLKFTLFPVVASVIFACTCFQISLWAIGETFPVTSLKRSATVLEYICTFSVQASILRLSVLGVITAGIISGFTSIYFPINQLMIFGGVDIQLIKSKESSLMQVLRAILSRKRSLLLDEQRQRAEAREIREAGGFFSGTTSALLRQINHKYSIDSYAASVRKEISLMEEVFQDMFIDLVNIRELHEQSAFSRTFIGRITKFVGYLLTVACAVKFAGASWNCVSYLLSLSSPYERSDNQNPDNVSRGILRLILLLFGVRADASFWAPLISFIILGSLAMSQVRSFLVTFQQFAKLGLILTTNTETYALVLAFVTGLYFMACVILLRSQVLPQAMLLDTTGGSGAVIGEGVRLSFFFWLFDVTYVASTTLFSLYLWTEQRKRRLVAESSFYHTVEERETSRTLGGDTNMRRRNV